MPPLIGRLLRNAGQLLAPFLLMLALTACGDSADPTVDTSSSTGIGSDAPSSTAVAADVADTSPIAATAPGSLEQYEALCSEASGDVEATDEAITYAELSGFFDDVIARWDEIRPPPEVADWHDATLAGHRAFQQAIDDYPGSSNDLFEDGGVEDYISTLFVVIAEQAALVDLAAAAMDPSIREQLLSYGCAVGFFDGADGSDSIAATEVAVGETVEFTITGDDEGEGIHFFNTEAGQQVIVTVLRGTLTDFVLTRPFTADQLLPSVFISADGNDYIAMRHEAAISGPHYFYVLADPPGAYTVTVEIDRTPTVPMNVRYAWSASESGVLDISWDPVDGATNYNVYQNKFADDCLVDVDGDTAFCKLMAPDITATSFASDITATAFAPRSPDSDGFYWVAACNDYGCSRPSETALAPAPRPQGPVNVTFAPEGSSVRVNWDPVEGAETYRIIHFFYDYCSEFTLNRGEDSCQEVATGVVEASYVHLDPAPPPWENFYWVLACSGGGCTAIEDGLAKPG